MSQAPGPSRKPGLTSAHMGLIIQSGVRRCSNDGSSRAQGTGCRAFLLQREVQRAEHIKQDPVLLSRGASLVTWLQMCGHLSAAVPHLLLA